MNLFAFLLILSFVSYISCKTLCNSMKTCGACIGNALESCIWCSENKIDNAFKCQPKSYEESNKNWCNGKVYYSSSNYTVKVDTDFSDKTQLRPLEITIKANPGEEVKFEVYFKRSLNFPLDVYFLMDYSYTMRSHTEELKKQAYNIYEKLNKLTNNVHLGIGSFIEKPGLPYTDIEVTKSDTYAFKNHLALTNNMSDFERAIAKPTFGSNYDDAEAGLDALMQVMACRTKLNWREDARKIIVLATDNTYHSAGDGKMLGAIKPINRICQLKENEYKREDSLKYDYPSVSFINNMATNYNFLIIFAVLPQVKTIYENLSKQISGSRCAVLQKNSNILEIIIAAYEESVGEVKINHDKQESFEVTIDQNCEKTKERNCKITPTSLNVTIPITIKSTSCSKTNKPKKITFNPLGLNDKVEVHFEVDCECGCEKIDPSTTVNTRVNCSTKGFIQCGACKCDKDWGGDKCEISCSDETSTSLYPQCLAPNSTFECSSNGKCECGKCKCADGFTGDVCEYNPNSCDTGNNGYICGGPARGICQFNKCTCKGDWTGNACDCPGKEISDKQCTGPLSIDICSGRGICECGKCICKKVKDTNETYSGAFCNLCKECAGMECKRLENYAKCNHMNKQEVCDKKFALTTETNIEVLTENKSELMKRDEWTTGTQCRTELDDGTILLFKFNTDTRTSLDTKDTTTNKMLLMIQKEVEVPPKANLLVPIASVIAGILLIGLLTVVFWKFLIEWYDKREYSKFCEQAKSQGYEVHNILYEPPTQNFDNPIFDPDHK